VLHAVVHEHELSYTRFIHAQSAAAKRELLELPFDTATAERFAAEAHESLARQRQIEAADTLPFETFRKQYLQVERLLV
jgi:glutamate--cysteine ligase